MFYYKEGGIIGIGATEKTIPIIPDDSNYEPYGIRGEMERTVEYTWDGKNYIQRHVKRGLTLYEKQINTLDGKEVINYIPVATAKVVEGAMSIADYISTNTISDLLKDKTMQKPLSWKDIAKFLEILLLIALVIATYYALVGDWHLSNSSDVVVAFNKTAQLAVKVCTFDLNNTRLQTAINNATLTQLKRIG